MRSVFLQVLLAQQISQIQSIWRGSEESETWDDENHNKILSKAESYRKMDPRQIQTRTGFTASTAIGNLDTVFGILTSDSTILGFLLTIAVQYVSMAVGWSGLGMLWYAARGIEVAEENQLNLPALFDFATGATGATINLVLGTGYWIAGLAVVVLLGNIGAVFGPKNSDPGRRSDWKGADDRLGVNPTQDLVLQVLDKKFSPQGVAETTWINTYLAASFVAFWVVMSMLKQPSSSRIGKRDTREKRASTHRKQNLIDRSHHREGESIDRSLSLLHSATLRMESL